MFVFLIVGGGGGAMKRERMNKDGVKTGEMVDRDWGHRKGQFGGKGNEFCLQPLSSLAKHSTKGPGTQGREGPFQRMGHLQIGRSTNHS